MACILAWAIYKKSRNGVKTMTTLKQHLCKLDEQKIREDWADRIEKIELNECIECGNQYSSYENAQNCCNHVIELTRFECPDCGNEHRTTKEAFNCCFEKHLNRIEQEKKRNNDEEYI